MLLNFLLFRRSTWFIPLILQGVAYFMLFRKMGINWWWAFIPGGGDWKLSTELFPKQRSFWRPFFTSVLLVACSAYLDPAGGSGMIVGRIFLLLAVIVYELFLCRLYMRLGKSFGKGNGVLFGLLTMLLPPLGILALVLDKKAEYHALTFKPEKKHGKLLTFLGRFGFVAVSALEALALIIAVGTLTVYLYPPRIFAQYSINDALQQTKDVKGTGGVVTREDTLGDAAADLASMPTSREKFFPDHSQDKSVVVLEYVIGSDLEDRVGFSSVNIAQMRDATKQGPGLSFVLQTGGSRRWFTKGIEDGTYGRYLLRDGNLEKVQELSSDTCMSEPSEFADFLTWAKENYPADRYMLVMWDHGGGLSSGYGVDALNRREEGAGTLSVSEIADAIKQSGLKFDVIGFDACLMQDIEIAVALEPYADYFLASEEVEGGFGWCYTSAFGLLAKNPGTSSEDFGHEIIAAYDPYNTTLKGPDGEPNTEATLSFVDLPLAKAAYQQMEGFFADARGAIATDSKSYADLSLAGTKSYGFSGNEQVDLIDFLSNIDRLDYEDRICTDEEREALINAFKACVLYRNANSADGINGIALTFPVASISTYSLDYEQLKFFSMTAQKDLYNDFFSIMAAQNKKELESTSIEDSSLMDVISLALSSDFTDEEWYVEGFENYEEQPALIDIPLTEVENGYKIEMPEKAWDLIADSMVVAYQKTDDNLLRYLGKDSIGGVDEDGRPLVALEGTWVHVGGKLVCYESESSRMTDEGLVYTGTVLARLNDDSDIKLYIEWDPVSGEDDQPVKGKVVGYTFVAFDDAEGFLSGLLGEDVLGNLMPKGKELLKTGDKVEFLFSYYDEEGNLVKTEPYGGAIRVSNMERIVVEDAPIGTSDVVFYGALTDVYQRVMTTEKIEAHIA